jgi:hypothetical protein
MVTIEAGDCTQSGNNTAEATWAVANPAAATGDLLIFLIAWDDSVSTTDVAEPAGPNGETLTEMNATPIRSAVAGGISIRMKAWYCKATGTWSAGTVTFTPTATEQWTATVIKVLAGEFDPTTPIGAIGTLEGTGETDTAALSPAFSAGASDGGGTLVWFPGVNSDTLVTLDAGWSAIANQDLGAVAHGVAVRNTAVTNAESIAQASWSIDSDSWASIAFVVRESGTGTTINPGKATLTLSGLAPTTSAFNSVRIREVLVNASGQAVGNASSITLLVWYSGIFRGAPDVSLNGMTTDANGTTSWSIATGTLAYLDPVAYIAQNSISYSHYAAGRMVPSYE